MDRELVERAQRGDLTAFESIATAAHPRLYGVALGILHEPSTAEDATQQALISIWRHIRRLRDPDKFEGWSYRLLVNACYDEAKKLPRWVPEEKIPAAADPAEVDPYTGVVDRDQLGRGFARLSVEQRAVIVLRFLHDLTLAQVAEALDVPIGTVASRLDRALKALRAALEADDRATHDPAPTRTAVR